MPVIDVHNHYYPPEYLDALGPAGSTLRLTTDRDGNPVVHYPGDYNVMVRGHRDIAYRREVLDEHGVDVQVITLTTPGTHVGRRRWRHGWRGAGRRGGGRPR